MSAHAQRLADSRGFILPWYLLLFCLATGPLLSLAALALEEEILTRRWVLAQRAGYLAERAFREWQVRAQEAASPQAPPATALFGATTPWEAAPIQGLQPGGSFTAQAAFAVDVENADGNAATTLLLHNVSFGFADAPFPTGGYPLVRVLAAGEVGTCRVEHEILVTFRAYDHPRTAAVVLCGPGRLAGPAVLDAREHDGEGRVLADLPSTLVAVAGGGAITVGPGVELLSSVDATVPLTDPPRDPYAVLGLAPESRYLERRTCAAGLPPWHGTRVFSASYTGPLRGAGTLVVHNPLFDPARYEAARKKALGLDDPAYDSGYSHLDPRNQPACLEPTGESTFTGLIIADDLRTGSGHFDLTGQLIVLTRSGCELSMSEGLDIRYSTEVLRNLAHGDCDRVISWRRLGR